MHQFVKKNMHLFTNRTDLGAKFYSPYKSANENVCTGSLQNMILQKTCFAQLGKNIFYCY